MKRASPLVLEFEHPEPEKTKGPVWPVFIPFAGCPFRCVYCSPYAQTGQSARNAHQTAQDMTAAILARQQETGRPTAIGFFGGTFTALKEKDMLLFLEQAWSLKRKGAVSHIRCSTRPDQISNKILDTLMEYGLDMIELGIQSFDDTTLEMSGRGYSGAEAVRACHMVRKHGFELGVQLLPGLPGSGRARFARDVALTRNIIPDIVRIYPCLVLKNTPLAKKMNTGSFRPWNLERTVSVVSRALLSLWLKKIPVIRLGLAPEPDLIKNILAGPWHPALGAICRSTALKSYFLSRLEETGASPALINIPGRYVSDFWGYNKMNENAYARKGITREMVKPREKGCFRIYLS